MKARLEDRGEWGVSRHSSLSILLAKYFSSLSSQQQNKIGARRCQDAKPDINGINKNEKESKSFRLLADRLLIQIISFIIIL